MRFASFFSGIGAPEVAWASLGWSPVAFAEIDKAASNLLKHYHPTVPNLGDIEVITEDAIAGLGPLDLIVFGFSCQDISIAGKRKGLVHDGDATRSGLFFEAMRLVRAARRRCGLRWVVVENTPGLYSSNAGRDFGTVVAHLCGAEFDVPRNGWGNSGAAAGDEGLVEWALLDARYRGLAQRRERVFFVADFGNWSGRPPVLLEPESMCGDPPPRRETGQDIAGSIKASAGKRGGYSEGECGSLIAFGGNNQQSAIDVATACRAKGGTGHGDFESETFVVGFNARQDPDNWEGYSGPLNGQSPQDQAVAVRSMVRRLTPVECERLQGFPDNYTAVLHRGKAQADGPRYKQLGNSMAVPKRKISAKAKGRKRTSEQIEEMRRRPFTAEHRRKIKAALKDRYFSPEHRAKITEGLKRRWARWHEQRA